MSTPHWTKERHKKRNRVSVTDGDGNGDNGTTARTRPLSFEEIMVKRKRKSLSEDVKDRKGDVKNVSRNIDSERERGPEKERNMRYGKKEKSSSANRNDSEIPTSGRKLKSVVSRPSDEIKEGKNDKRSNDYALSEAGKQYPWHSRGKESHTDRSRINSERERMRKYQNAEKKLDTTRHHETKVSERGKKKESSKSNIIKPKVRARRSRSRNRDDRHRRSRSPHPSKDRSQKHNHIDQNRLSSNGLSTSHKRRRDEPKSGLGGYSPRKRLSEDAAKTPPPPDHSISEKKSAKWDVPLTEADKILPSSVSLNIQSSNNVASNSMPVHVNPIPVKMLSGVSVAPLSMKVFASSVDSIQLTQATRPMRRLCVDNIPSNMSEKDLVKWFNDLFLSSGVNHIPGTEPCINCSMNKDKALAIVEFLTPEDASTALSFDGSSVSDSVLKIRRPKDFVEVATGDLDNKSAPAVTVVSDVVKDSPNKIFIGGISEHLSSKMLMEIVSTFGPLKAYHFEVNANPSEPCAFLEYVDKSVTLKACASLNGMKFGGKLLTVVQACRGAESLDNIESAPLYEIPEHAKPLLKQPTQVLKLRNVFDVEGLSVLSELGVEEVVDDIRLECSRFGSVKSVNVIKQVNTRADPHTENDNANIENSKHHTIDESNGVESPNLETKANEPKAEDEVENDNDSTVKRSLQPSHLESDLMSEHLDIDAKSPERRLKPKENQTVGSEDRIGHGINDELEVDTKAQSDAMENIFEVGSVLVEFGRTEAASSAAHCLHGRVFDARVVSVEYIALDHYKSWFPK